MPSDYTGNPLATQAPSPAPGPGAVPIVAIPSDTTDDMNAASIAQAMKVPTDFIAYMMKLINAQLPTSGNDAPQMMFKDTAGNNRSVVDHNGYPIGRRNEFRQEWYRSDTAYGWFTNPDTNVAWGRSNYPSPIAKRNGGTSINTFYALVTENLVDLRLTGISLVLEFDVAFSTLTATNTTLYAGLDPGQGVSSNFIGLQCTGGNWLATLGSTTSDTGVVPLTTTDPPQRIRIEVHGSASPYGSAGNGKARFFVNDVLKKELSGAIPVLGGSGHSIVVGNSVGGSAASVATDTYCGAVYMTWNRVLSLPNL